jgi:hypothetical protein
MVNHKETCPFLCQVTVTGESKPVSIHAWMDTSLRNLADVLTITNPKAEALNTKLIFKTMEPQSGGDLKPRDLGTVYTFKHSRDDSRTLSALGFRIGDLIQVTIAECQNKS